MGGLATALILLTLFASASAQQASPKTGPSSQVSESIFQRDRSPVTWKTLTLPFRDLASHLAKEMGWEEGFRAGFEKSVQAYFTSDRALELLGFGVQAGLTILFALLAWRFLSPLLLRFRESFEKRPTVTTGTRWAAACLRIVRDVLAWGLVAAAGSLTIEFLGAQSVIEETAIAILLSVAAYRVGRALLMEFLNPDSSNDRLIRCSDAGAAHLFHYLNRVLFFAALWLPVLQFFKAIDYHRDFQELLLVFFRVVIFFLLILLASNKKLVLAAIPTASATGRRVSHWVQSLYPVFIGYILGLFGLYSLGYLRLARFVLTSTAYSLVIGGGAILVAAWLRRNQRTRLKRVDPEVRILPLSPESLERIRNRTFDVLVLLVGAGAGLVILTVWGLDFTHLRQLVGPLTVTLFTLGATRVSLWVLIQVVLVLTIVILISRSIRVVLGRRILPRAGVDVAVQHTILSTLHYLIIAVGTIIALQTVGLDLTALTVFAGVLGVGIGFGLQNIANNFVSGIILLADRSIKVGDFVDVAGTLGTVERIGARYTVVQTLDNIAVLVPNSSFVSERVVNWSHGSPVTRLHVKVGVAYGSDTELVEQVLLEAGKAHSLILSHPPPKVHFEGFQDSALGFDLLVWTNRPEQNQIIISELNFAVDRAFRENHITIPFPQRDLHLRSSIPFPLDGPMPEVDGSVPVSKAPRETK
jgi:small-conductance mechanosensitive channel